MDDRIRQILREQGGLGSVADGLAEDAELRQAGLTSLASVNVMLALEKEFGIEFPDHLLGGQTFATIASIRRAVSEVLAASSGVGDQSSVVSGQQSAISVIA
jgi:acyl carrier protein